MPITESAKKALRQTKTRTEQNRTMKNNLKGALKKAILSPSKETVSLVFQAADKAAKKGVIPKNKAARLKSRISKLLKK